MVEEEELKVAVVAVVAARVLEVEEVAVKVAAEEAMEAEEEVMEVVEEAKAVEEVKMEELVVKVDHPDLKVIKEMEVNQDLKEAEEVEGPGMGVKEDRPELKVMLPELKVEEVAVEAVAEEVLKEGLIDPTSGEIDQKVKEVNVSNALNLLKEAIKVLLGKKVLPKSTGIDLVSLVNAETDLPEREAEEEDANMSVTQALVAQ